MESTSLSINNVPAWADSNVNEFQHMNNECKDLLRKIRDLETNEHIVQQLDKLNKYINNMQIIFNGFRSRLYPYERMQANQPSKENQMLIGPYDVKNVSNDMSKKRNYKRRKI
jgi:hypothetical protein